MYLTFTICVCIISLIFIVLCHIKTKNRVLNYYLFPKIANAGVFYIVGWLWSLVLPDVNIRLLLVFAYLIYAIYILMDSIIPAVTKSINLVDVEATLYYLPLGYRRVGGWYRKIVITSDTKKWKMIEWMDYFKKPSTYAMLLKGLLKSKVRVVYLPLSKQIISLSGSSNRQSLNIDFLLRKLTIKS